MATTQRTYDHRLRGFVHATGDLSTATRIGVPRSTASGWIRRPNREVVSHLALCASEPELQSQLSRQRKRVRKLLAILRVARAAQLALDVDLKHHRIPDGDSKATLIKSIERAQDDAPLPTLLRSIGLSSSRYHAWKRAERSCELEDHSSCPKSSPQSLTPDEVETIHGMVTSPDFRHIPTGALAIKAQRNGDVFASPSTWRKLTRERKWRRPRTRVHPQKPKMGIRAKEPDELWHVDTTLVRLLDGSRVYVHAVIDNYSRRILAWRVTERFEPASTAMILIEAGHYTVGDASPTLLVDAGIENMNSDVDQLIASGVLRRLLAQVEVQYSNSMIEAWWRSLKHQWLYLNRLDSAAAVRRLVEFYVREHNTQIPHSAFRGETPDEMYFGSTEDIPEELKKRKAEARTARLAKNRALSCGVCA